MNLSEAVLLLIEGNFDGKYYLAFGYEGQPSLDDMHITHTYFGNCTHDEVLKIAEVIENYFATNRFNPFQVSFPVEEFFGPEKNIRVMRPGTPDDNSDYYLPELRNLLYPFNKSTFKDEAYKPHTSTSLPKVEGTINRVCLASGENIIKQWH